MLLNNLLNLGLNVARDVARRDRLEQLSLLARKMLTEVRLPLGDLVDGDGVELEEGLYVRQNSWNNRERSTYETVDTSVDDGDLDLHRQWLVLTLLCRVVSNKH